VSQTGLAIRRGEVLFRRGGAMQDEGELFLLYMARRIVCQVGEGGRSVGTCWAGGAYLEEMTRVWDGASNDEWTDVMWDG
jgi:hypothetical protein